MLSLTKSCVFGAAAAIVLAATTAIGLSQDKETVLKNRQALMKEQGENIGKVKAYLDGKGDLAQAQAGAGTLSQTTRKIPDVFPPGTGGPSPDGKFAAKPLIWSDWNKFLDAQKNASGKADALLAATKSGDKTAMTAAFGDLGKNGCGACHETFREKLQD